MKCTPFRLPHGALSGCSVALLVLGTLSLVPPPSRAAQPAAPAAGKQHEGLQEEFFQRLARVPPRSASAHVKLGEWCKLKGLKQYAAQCFRTAIAIDGDCEKARAALGYRRRGEIWVLPGAEAPSRQTAGDLLPPTISRPATASGTAESSKPSVPEGKAPAAAGGAAAAAPATRASPAASGPTPTPQAREVAPPAAQAAPTFDPVAAEQEKIARAEAAARKLAVTFTTHKDNDFLVHTTLSRSSRELKAFLTYLKLQKKALVAVLGVSSSARLWPGKVQFFLMRSQPEFERFGLLIDAMKSVKTPDGAYTANGHTVVLKVDTGLVPRLLAREAVLRFNGSNRYISWWIQEGLSSWLYAQSPPGIKEKYYQGTMVYAGATIRAEGPSLKIFTIVDSASYPRKEARKNQALAFTLVDFLIQYKRRGFQDLVKALKSPEAPEPPAGPGDLDPGSEQFRAFFGAYVSFQEETLHRAFRKPVEELGNRWKQYVIENAIRFQRISPSSDSTPRRGRRTR